MKAITKKTYKSSLKSGTFAFLTFSVIFASHIFVKAFNDTSQTSPDEIKQKIKRAEKLFRRGENFEAEKLLRLVLKSSPKNPRASLALAAVLNRLRIWGEAYQLALEVVQKDPKNAYGFALLGETLLNLGDFQDAKLAFVNSNYLDNDEALAWAGLGMLDFYENRLSDSLGKLREAVYLDPGEPNYLFALGQVAARSERYREAAEAYEKFLRISVRFNDDRRERIAGLIRFLRYLGGKPSLYKIGSADQTTVPILIVGNRPVIELKINNHDESLSFVLDTGSGISVISKETAAKLKVRPITKGGNARALGGDGKFEIVYGFLQKVTIGEVKVRNVPVYIREFQNVGHQVDGYIGISLISKFLTTVDYGNRTFTLAKQDSKMVINSENTELSLPLRLTSSGFLSGQVQVEGLESDLNFIVDTGASVSVISNNLANAKEIVPYLKEETMRVIGAAGITENVPSYMLPKITFGEHSRQSILAVALNLDIINETSGFEQSGILGGNFLRDYKLTFDFENSKVIFVPNIK